MIKATATELRTTFHHLLDRARKLDHHGASAPTRLVAWDNVERFVSKVTLAERDEQLGLNR